MLIKLTADNIAKLGGIKDQAGFDSTLNALVESANTPKTEQKVVALADVQTIVAKNFETFTASTGALSAEVATLKAELAKVNPEAIVKTAGEAGSRAAAQALGKVGASGAGAIESNPTEGGTNNDPSAALIGAGKFEEAWNASESLQKEFPTGAAAYAAFKRAEKRGGVAIFQPKTK